MNVAVGRKDLQNTRLFEASALAPPGQSNDEGEREHTNYNEHLFQHSGRAEIEVITL